MTELTVAQQLLPIKQAIGRPVQLRPYESIVRVKVDPEEILLVLQVYDWTETAREVRFHKSGLRMRIWKLKDGKWKEQFERDPDGKITTLTVWDDDFKPYTECKFGYSLSPQEYYDRLERERMTYRPGTFRTPLDSFERTVQCGPSGTTPKMYRYWTGHDRDDTFTTESEEELGDD